MVVLCVHLHDIAVAAGLILEKGENRMLIAAILQTHTDTHHIHEDSFGDYTKTIFPVFS
jgi:hypothetical protein